MMKFVITQILDKINWRDFWAMIDSNFTLKKGLIETIILGLDRYIFGINSELAFDNIFLDEVFFWKIIKWS